MSRRFDSPVWYPSVDDVVYANFAVFALGDDKHPHDLVRSREAIQSVLSQVRLVEEKGVIY
ncbi:hypothetical protein MUP79_09750, partial [Candidatus Bathyarchaeota archaeon]|nr:hypothetical protein [Candidatus Bathyarchaeota archaeon]